MCIRGHMDCTNLLMKKVDFLEYTFYQRHVINYMSLLLYCFYIAFILLHIIIKIQLSKAH